MCTRTWIEHAATLAFELPAGRRSHQRVCRLRTELIDTRPSTASSTTAFTPTSVSAFDAGDVVLAAHRDLRQQLHRLLVAGDEPDLELARGTFSATCANGITASGTASGR